MSGLTLKGSVVRCASDKTSVVRVFRVIEHSLYKKKMRRFKQYLCHDQENRCRVGDEVVIRQSAPHSKKKKFEIVEIVCQDVHGKGGAV